MGEEFMGMDALGKIPSEEELERIKKKFGSREE
jgi:hypothetical protein